jgi:hypothetical protein
MSAAQTPTTTWSDWDAEGCGLECQAGVGLTISDFSVPRGVIRWLCWDEVVDLHRWLGAKIAEHQGQ